MLTRETGGMRRSDRSRCSRSCEAEPTATRDRSVKVVLAGELDVAAAHVVRAELDPHVAAAPARLVIDLRCVEFMDCSVVATLVEVARRVHATGGVVALRHPRRAVRKLLEVCNVAAVPGLSVECPADRPPRACPGRTEETGCG